MKPYWNSNLTVKEAQELSHDGIAVLGNPVMKDIIWLKESNFPQIWIKNAYKPLDPTPYENRLGWVPANPITNDTFG